MINFSAIVKPVLLQILGEPNNELSTAKELRYGRKGSLSVHPAKGIWSDFETGESGGFFDLIQLETNSEPMQWLRDNGYASDTRTPFEGALKVLNQGSNKAPVKQQGSTRENPITLNLSLAPATKKSACFTYTNEHGEPLYRIIKSFDDQGQRQFKQQHFDNDTGAWLNGLKNPDSTLAVTKTLYNLPQLTQSTSEPVYIVEGEKDVESLKSLGYVAITSGGAKSWQSHFADYLVGREIVVIPDHDQAGTEYADAVIASLQGKAKSIKRVDLSKHWQDMPAKADVTDALESGMTQQQFDAIVKQTPFIEPLSDAPAPRKSCIVSFDQLLEHQDPPAWLIKNVLLEHGTTTLFAESGAGKSFVAIDMALHIAAGKEWQGHKTKVGHVAYIAAEGVDGFTYRVKAWVNHHKVRPAEGGSFHVITKGFAINEPNELEQLLEQLDSLPNQPNLIIIDTLARNFTGDENHATAMGLFIRGADVMRDRYHCNVLTIHHAGKGDLDSARGSTALKGAMDRELKLLKKDGYKVLSDGKVKDGKEGHLLTFELVDVDTGVIDEDGESVSSAVISAVNATSGREAKRLSATMRLGLETFASVAIRHKADLETWRKAYYPKSTRDTIASKCTAFQQVRAKLVSEGIMSVDNDVYTLNQKSDYPEVTGIMVTANFSKTQEELSDSANDDFYEQTA